MGEERERRIGGGGREDENETRPEGVPKNRERRIKKERKKESRREKEGGKILAKKKNSPQILKEKKANKSRKKRKETVWYHTNQSFPLTLYLLLSLSLLVTVPVCQLLLFPDKDGCLPLRHNGNTFTAICLRYLLY